MLFAIPCTAQEQSQIRVEFDSIMNLDLPKSQRAALGKLLLEKSNTTDSLRPCNSLL